jgi:curli biogenesis system outer membrane secretion channel CsgG
LLKAFVVGILSCLLWIGCAATPKMHGPVAVAVWDLENLSISDAASADLGDILSGKILETVRQAAGYTVVERQQLQLALRELELGSSDLVDSATQLRIGRIVGAKEMIFGAYQVIGKQMRLDLRLVDVESGRILKAAEKTTPSSDISGWIQAATDAATALVTVNGE